MYVLEHLRMHLQEGVLQIMHKAIVSFHACILLDLVMHFSFQTGDLPQVRFLSPNHSSAPFGGFTTPTPAPGNNNEEYLAEYLFGVQVLSAPGTCLGLHLQEVVSAGGRQTGRIRDEQGI